MQALQCECGGTYEPWARDASGLCPVCRDRAAFNGALSRAASSSDVGQAIRDLVADEVARAVAPLRAEVERLRAAASDGMVTQDEAARRLGVTRRAVQRWLRDGRLEVVAAGGVRMVRWPPVAAPR